MKILLVEDDLRVASFIRKGLKEENYTVDHARDGDEALYWAQTNTYDLIILDLLLPKKNGLEVLKTLRNERCKTPVLILTAKDEPRDKVTGLDSGADDYLTKPFEFDEFLARVRALLRRSSDLAPLLLKAGDLTMDVLQRKVTRGQEIPLTSREYALLEYFLRHPNQVITRTMLSEQVWEQDFDSFTNVIDVHIARLRRKIDDGHSTKLIATVRGSGYRLECPENQ